ncbi:MAG: GNAT family N-acetyltransferase [Desulfovibrio sp.]|jgi:CelD/BcsL family acetyltransferase involved in cellulose biosynthesis|nr:GNAT family N-acetyltransferase [Desulfovibrio sp.]
MKFQYISPASCPEHFPTWAKAAVSTNQADPFCCSPVWQLAFHDAFGPKRRLFIEESSGSALVFAEKAAANGKIYLTPIEPHWFFGCPLLGSDSCALLSAALEFLEKQHAPAFPEIVISGIRHKGRLSRRLLRTFGGSFDFYLYSAGIQCAASLHGGVDGFLSRRSANHRHKLKKEYRSACNSGIYFERSLPSSASEAGAAYSRMLEVELSSWKGIGRCGMAEPPSRQFYDIMLRRLSASRQGRVIFARHEDRDIGFIFGGKAGNIYRGQQFSYADDWKSFSIGNLMQMEQIKWLCEEGAKRYDMGPLVGPRMEYKTHWTEKKMPIQTWILKRK